VFTLLGISFFLIGILLMGVGVVGEYVGRIYEQVRQRPRFTVAALLEKEEEKPHDVLDPRDAVSQARTTERVSGAGG
jgi:hypothetical protein